MAILKLKILPFFLFFWGLLFLVSTGTARADHVQFYVDALPPYAVLHEDSPPTGFAVELMGHLMDEVGEHFAPSDIKVMNWARAVHEVEVVAGTSLLVLAKLPERVDRFKWVGPMDTLPIGVFAAKDSHVVVKKVSDLKKYSIGMVRNTAPYRVLIKAVPEIWQNLIMLSGIPAQLRMLREGRVDVIVQAVGASNTLMDDEGMDTENYRIVYRFEPLQIYFGFNKSTNDKLIRRLQSALDRFKQVDASGTSPYDRLREKFFGGAEAEVSGETDAE
ncbi:transporter substrate-binding domain-containing protein [uncultured Pseudodesulfovibrio sp.]|uniref:substrate-binding periplasmic protein n=1 Tax=uncultured Pseudodesulfovibrio sp. TaxID=2035858 RepID=UPI0029C8815A|nr:transporter substrate-binding domain-containing protein [uncultured Pseudodesulfovibrio sp.]